MTARTPSPIIVGYDGSAGARAALDWAAEEARHRMVPLRLVYAIDLAKYVSPHLVLPLDDERKAAEAELQRAVGELADRGVKADAHIGVGRPAGVLLDVATAAPLVVVGSRGRSGFTSLLLGSTSLHVAMHAACPVIVVRPDSAVARTDSTDLRSDHPGRDGGRWPGRVVVGVDGSPLSEAAIAFAFEAADLLGVGLTAVHAWQRPEFAFDPSHDMAWDMSNSDERALLSERLAGWNAKYPDVDVIQHSVQATATAALVAESQGAVLTVVGARGAGGFKGLLLGSVSHAVLHHACSPVAVVRPETSPA